MFSHHWTTCWTSVGTAGGTKAEEEALGWCLNLLIASVSACLENVSTPMSQHVSWSTRWIKKIRFARIVFRGVCGKIFLSICVLGVVRLSPGLLPTRCAGEPASEAVLRIYERRDRDLVRIRVGTTLGPTQATSWDENRRGKQNRKRKK